MKNLLKIGKALSKAEQKLINGGVSGECTSGNDGQMTNTCDDENDCDSGSGHAFIPWVCIYGCCHLA